MRAFTLLEMLIVIALVASGAVLSAIAGTESMEGARAEQDLDRALSILRRARSLAQANACREAPCTIIPTQGVRLTSESVTLFEGAWAEQRAHETFDLSGMSRIEDTFFVFIPGSGRAERAYRIPVTGAQGTSYLLQVSEAGVIDLLPL